jgi:hypothetical protein
VDYSRAIQLWNRPSGLGGAHLVRFSSVSEIPVARCDIAAIFDWAQSQ